MIRLILFDKHILKKSLYVDYLGPYVNMTLHYYSGYANIFITKLAFIKLVYVY